MLTETTIENIESAMTVAYEQLTRVLVEQTEKAIVDTFAKICGSELTLDADFRDWTNRQGIVGAIAFVHDLGWSLALILPSNSAESIARKFAGFEISFDSADMEDVAGELVNVLSGVLSGNLEDAGIASKISLPQVARGAISKLMMPDALISERLYFSSNEHDFWVEITAIN